MKWNSSENVIVAFLRSSNILPTILGKQDWDALTTTFQELLEDEKLPLNQGQLRTMAMYIMNMVSANDKALEVLNEEIKTVYQERLDLEKALSSFSELLEVDELRKNATFNYLLHLHPQSAKGRVVVIGDGGVDGAWSIKLKNFEMNPKDLTYLDLGFLEALLISISDTSHTILIAVGILHALLFAINGSTSKLTVTNATVLWGFLQAKNQSNEAPTTAILREANKARMKNGLPVLDLSEFMEALNDLRRQQIIKRIEDSKVGWQLSESIKVT